MKYFFLLTGIIPGLGQAHSGHAWRGLLFFCLFVFLANSVLMMPFLYRGETGDVLRYAAAIGACLVWLISFLDLFRLVYRRNSRTSSKETDASQSKTEKTEEHSEEESA